MGGEAQRLTDTIQDVDDFAWAPDGKRLVLVLRDPSPGGIRVCQDEGKGRGSSDKTTPVKANPRRRRPWVIDRYYFKTDTVGYLDHRRTHLYVFDIASKSLKQVSSGDYDDERSRLVSRRQAARLRQQPLQS